MGEIAAVFVDLDDTFLAPDKSIPPENLAVMDELAARDIELVPCTGRHVNGVPRELREHRSVRHVVASNGGVVYDLRAERDLRTVCISPDQVLFLYGRLGGLPVVFDVFADGRAYAERARRALLEVIDVPEGLRAYLKRDRTFLDATVPEFLPTIGPVTKLSLFFEDDAGARAIHDAVDATGELYYVQTSASNYETMHVDATKGAALAWLCAHQGWDVGATIAFGDNHNDVTMIEAAGDGVVMENGEPQVKALADHIAPPAAEGGVAAYLRGRWR